MNCEGTIIQLKRMIADRNLTGAEHKALLTAMKATEILSKDDAISRKSIKEAKFPEKTNMYTEGWNDAIDSIISNEKSIREKEKL